MFRMGRGPVFVQQPVQQRTTAMTFRMSSHLVFLSKANFL
ncbi:MAG: hypothetical protein GQF41_2332 [Candidatus Rifleibacterium amylolyticum]|nr:MAG: hypothetical protein GQF41_2332 [Candidatus Rifleibacterium amylolyticum]